MIRIPVHLGAIFGVHDVLDREPVQILVLAQGLDDVPRQAVDIDPPALDPVRLGLLDELDQLIICELMNLQITLGKIDNSDLTGGVEMREGSGLSPVGLGRVHARLGAGLPSRVTGLEVVKLLYG